MCFRPEITQSGALLTHQSNVSLLNILQKAQQVSHKSIVTFGSFRQEVFNELSNVEESAGIRVIIWDSDVLLNETLELQIIKYVLVATVSNVEQDTKRIT